MQQGTRGHGIAPGLAFVHRHRLAERKLPEVEALIERAEAMKEWLTVATGCECETLDVCALFEGKPQAGASGNCGTALEVTHVG